jgi:EmrB/QacA subfamily drug resistance transporter
MVIVDGHGADDPADLDVQAGTGPDANVLGAPGGQARSEVKPPDPQHARRWWVLAVLCLGQLMTVLDVAIVNIALPHAQAELHFSDHDRQWVITAYSLAYGSLILLSGRVADLFGRKRVLLTGAAGFAAASAVGGASVSFAMLVTARAVQGAFAALLAPAVLALLTTTFTGRSERGMAFGVYGGVSMAGASAGLLLGGVLTEYLNWRWVMYVNLIFAALVLVGGMALLENRPAEHRPGLDLPGTVLVCSGLFCLVYGLSQAGNASGTQGWTSAVTLGFLTGSVVLLAAFVLAEGCAAHPLLPLRIVLDRNRGGAYIAILLAVASMYGVFLFLTYYLEGTLRYSPVKTGLSFLPLTVMIMITSVAGNALIAPRVSPRLLIPAALAVAAAGMAMLTRIGLDSGYVTTVLPATLVQGAGLGLVFAPASNLGTSGVAPRDAGAAAATVNASRQIGGSIGLALFSTIAAEAASGYLTAHLHSAPLPRLLAQAAVHSYTTAFWASTATFALAAVLTAALLRPGRPGPGGQEAAS